jgi:hypothetical protein
MATLLVGASAGTSFAVPVLLNNPSFEDDGPGIPSWATSTTQAIPETTVLAGHFVPLPETYASVPDGAQIAYLFNGYWFNGTKTGNPAVRASYWKKIGKDDYLVAVSNWDSRGVETSVQLPKDFESISQLTDMESGETIPLAAGQFKLTLPAHDLRVFRCER